MQRTHLTHDIDQEGEEGVQPIVRTSLHDAIITRLRDMIIEGELQPGQRLHEVNLCKSLGVSRTPLREALKFLLGEGLIEIIPHRGTTVRQFSEKEVFDCLIILGKLEFIAGQLACKFASDADVAKLRNMHDQMMELYSQRKRLSYFKINQDIHSLIITLSGNQALIHIHAILQARLKRIRYIGNEVAEKWAAAVEDHCLIIKALESRNEKALSEILELHMLRTWDRVKDVLASSQTKA